MNIRKVIVFFLLLIVANGVLAQKITGFGEYKIGITIDEFLNQNDIKVLKLKDKIKSMIVPDDGELWRTTAKSELDRYNNKVYSDDVVKFELKITTGVESIKKDSYETTITFFRNKLVNIYIHNPPSEFLDILSEKYGKPKLINKIEYVTCQNSYGAKTEHMDGYLIRRWTSDNGLEVEYSISMWDCGKSRRSYEVKDKKLDSIVKSIERAGYLKELADDAKLKASKSKI